MASERACYRAHCGECRHFALDERRTAINRKIYGERMPDVHRCEMLGIRVDRFDSPQSPISVAAGCFSYEKGGRNGH